MYKFDNFRHWIACGREIEFEYSGKRYSVTYGVNDKDEKRIYFCEFYQPDTEFIDANDFMKNSKIGEHFLSDIWEDVTEVDIF